MSTKKTDVPLTVNSINDNIHAVAIGAEQLFPISREDAFKFFEQAGDDQFETLGGASYLDLDKYKPGKYVFEFTGVTSWRGVDQRTGQSKEVPAVKLTDAEGNEYICAGKLIVDNCSAITQVPCLIRLVYRGKKRANNGNMYFDVQIQVGAGVITSGLTGD